MRNFCNQRINYSQSVYSSKNLAAQRVTIPCLVCPANHVRTGDNIHHSSYVACHHDGEAPIDMDNVGVFTLNSSTRYEMITDGTSYTIFLGETRLPMTNVGLSLAKRGPVGLLGWMSGTRSTLRNASGINVNDLAETDEVADPTGPVGGFGSNHQGGAYFSWGDGSVRFLSDSIDTTILHQMAHPADGELRSSFE